MDADTKDNLLPFPMIMVQTQETDVPDLEEHANDERNFVDDPFFTKKELRDDALLKALEKKNETGAVMKQIHKGIGKLLRNNYGLKTNNDWAAEKLEITEEEKKKREELLASKREYTFRCPVFATS